MSLFRAHLTAPHNSFYTFFSANFLLDRLVHMTGWVTPTLIYKKISLIKLTASHYLMINTTLEGEPLQYTHVLCMLHILIRLLFLIKTMKIFGNICYTKMCFMHNDKYKIGSAFTWMVSSVWLSNSFFSNNPSTTLSLYSK